MAGMVQYFWVVVLGLSLSFFLSSIYKKKDTLHCVLWIIVFSLYLWISKPSLSEQFSRFPVGRLPLGVSPGNLMAVGTCSFSSWWLFCVLALSQHHVGLQTIISPLVSASWLPELPGCLCCFTSHRCSHIPTEKRKSSHLISYTINFDRHPSIRFWWVLRGRPRQQTPEFIFGDYFMV